jgi:hypothetical protein
MCKTDEIKIGFENHFRTLLKKEVILKNLIFEVFTYGTAYVVGGFFRDFLNNQKSRDIDIIVDVKNTYLLDIIKSLNYPFETNRHGGIKLELDTITVDLWSLEDNWAFKKQEFNFKQKQLVKLNEEDKLNSIAKGCFFNYDSLVINLNNFSYNLRYYNEFNNKMALDILQKSVSYKKLNPTTEANIIRAIFIKNKFNVKFTENTALYMTSKLGHLKDLYQNEIQRLVEIKQKYPKYKELSDTVLQQEIELLMNDSSRNRQLFLSM